MEFLILFAIGFLIRGSLEHSKGDRARSRDQRVKEVAKTHPKGSLNKSQQKAAARRHATGWWAREIRHGFPVHRTGWHAAWLAHQTVADHHKARREEARTTALETRASVLKGMPEHKQRQAEAQKELDAIRGQLAEWERQVPDVPPRGKRAVREARDEVARKRKEREQATGPRCPSCGAPEGYDHLAGCDPTAPPLPADSVRPAAPVVIDTPVRVHNAEDSAHLNPGEPRCEGCGGTGRNEAGNDACPVCRGWGSGPPDPMSPLADTDAVCTTCGNKGKPGDPVLADPGGNIHLSHAQEQQEAYWDRLNRLRNQAAAVRAANGRRPERLRGASRYWIDYKCRDIGYGPEEGSGEFIYDGPMADGKHEFTPVGGGPSIYLFPDQIQDISEADHGPESDTHASPTTQGAPVTADTNYKTVTATAVGFVAQTEGDATAYAERRKQAENHLEAMQAAGVDAESLSAQMDLVDKLRAAEEAVKVVPEYATTVSTGLQKRHGGIDAAVDDAPIPQAAQPEFYGGG